MPEFNGLYATPTRKRFVEDVDGRYVYQQPESHDSSRIVSFYDNGMRCTGLANETERAGWIERGQPVQGMTTRFWWQLTDLGRQVKDGAKKEEHGG